MHAGVRIPKAHHPRVVGAGDRRLAELARLEEEDPLVRAGRPHELLLRLPQHFAQKTHLAGLLVCELPKVEERTEVGTGADQEVEVVRVTLNVMEPGDGEQDDGSVGVLVRRAAGSESCADRGDPLRCTDELDLHHRGGDRGSEPPRSARVGVAVVRDARIC